MDEDKSIFKIRGQNLTQLVEMSSYDVLQVTEYDEWVDANYTTHREIKRSKVKGTLTLFVNEPSEMDGLMHLIEDQKLSDGTNMVEVYVNNLRTRKTIWAYIDIDSMPLYDPIMGIKKHNGYKVTIEEK